jgi:hypothetical protein
VVQAGPPVTTVNTPPATNTVLRLAGIRVRGGGEASRLDRP